MVSRELAHILDGTNDETSHGKHRHHLYTIRQRRHTDDANQQRKEAGHHTASKRLDTPIRPRQETAMGDYRYTELPLKLPPLFRAPAFCVVPV